MYYRPMMAAMADLFWPLWRTRHEHHGVHLLSGNLGTLIRQLSQDVILLVVVLGYFCGGCRGQGNECKGLNHI